MPSRLYSMGHYDYCLLIISQKVSQHIATLPVFNQQFRCYARIADSLLNTPTYQLPQNTPYVEEVKSAKQATTKFKSLVFC